MINVGIVGARGYTGRELIRYLLRHSEVRITNLWAREVDPSGVGVATSLPEFKDLIDLRIQPFDPNQVKGVDVLFLALPHTTSMQVVPKLLKRVALIIDLSADYRLKDYKVYEKWYGVKHLDKGNLKRAVYGLPELLRDEIKGAKLIANPGCYPTGIILALYPLASKGLLKGAKVIVDSKSGTSGAGRKKDQSLLFSELNENVRPYNINRHRHIPEVTNLLKERCNAEPDLVFVPQVLPLTRGIISTIYVVFEKKPKSDLHKLFKEFYEGETFIRIYGRACIPELKNVAYSNFCDIGYLDFVDQNTFLIISCLDNLGKGASGQAVQNMNIALGYKEELGLL